MKFTAYYAVVAGITILQLGCGGGSDGLATCGAFSACGGDLAGKWSIDGVCVDDNLADAMEAEMELPAACDGIVKDIDVDISGTFQYANGTETADVSMAYSVQFDYTATCLTAMAGTTISVDQTICSALASSQGSADGFDTTCKLASGGCSCAMSISKNSIQDTDTYSTNGGTLSYGDGESVEYCVAGDTLTFFRDLGIGAASMQVKAHRVQ